VYVPYVAELSHKTHGQLAVAGRTLGRYRDASKSGADKVRAHAEAYQPPMRFVELTPKTQDLLVSPHLRLEDLVVPDEDTGERHTDVVPVDYELISGIETFRQALAHQGVDPDTLRFLSIFRSPRHNRAVGSGTFSRHKYMDAFDFIIDADEDGAMDDLTGDGEVDRDDGLWLVALVEALQGAGRLPVGGIGVYTFVTSEHKVTLHVDFRGHRARWAYHHGAGGRRHEFSWTSRAFAAHDRAEREKHPDRWQAPAHDLPQLPKPLAPPQADG
jgi:uncharacterized protein YcbK (DUF882 family)